MNTTQLFDPVADKSIAIWDFKHNAPYFFEHGFLRRDPTVDGNKEFVHDPSVFPFKPQKGIKLVFLYSECRNFVLLNSEPVIKI